MSSPPMLPSTSKTVSAFGTKTIFAARWLAYAYPGQRFAIALADDCACLGATVVRYSFSAVDLHHLLLAGFAGAPFIRFSMSPRAQ